MGRFGQRPELSEATGMALECCILGKFLGVVCHRFPTCLDVPTFSTRCLHVRHFLRDPSGGRWKFGRECCPVILPKWLPRNWGSFTCRKSTKWDWRLYFAYEGRRAEEFFAVKDPTVSAGFEPTYLGTKGQQWVHYSVSNVSKLVRTHISSNVQIICCWHIY